MQIVKLKVTRGQVKLDEHRSTEPRWLNVKDLNSQQHSKQSESIPQCTVGGKTDPIKASTKQPSEKVAGVRRIWGTMRGC